MPLGSFKTHVVRYWEKGQIEVFGKTQEQEIIRTWWISPDLGLWVKRTDQIGDEISVHQAVDVLE